MATRISPLPVIDGVGAHEPAVLLQNVQNWIVRNLELTQHGQTPQNLDANNEKGKDADQYSDEYMRAVVHVLGLGPPDDPNCGEACTVRNIRLENLVVRDGSWNGIYASGGYYQLRSATLRLCGQPGDRGRRVPQPPQGRHRDHLHLLPDAHLRHEQRDGARLASAPQRRRRRDGRPGAQRLARRQRVRPQRTHPQRAGRLLDVGFGEHHDPVQRVASQHDAAHEQQGAGRLRLRPRPGHGERDDPIQLVAR